MEKYDNFFHDKYPCSKTSMLVFEQGHLSRKNLPRTIFACVNYLSRKTCHIFHLHLPRKTCQGELASVYSRQLFLDKGTCQGKLASVNEAWDMGTSDVLKVLKIAWATGKCTFRNWKTLSDHILQIAKGVHMFFYDILNKIKKNFKPQLSCFCAQASPHFHGSFCSALCNLDLYSKS